MKVKWIFLQNKAKRQEVKDGKLSEEIWIFEKIKQELNIDVNENA